MTETGGLSLFSFTSCVASVAHTSSWALRPAMMICMLCFLYLCVCLIHQSSGFRTLTRVSSANRLTHLYSTPNPRPFKNFDDMLSQLEQPVLVDFYTTWCGPCQMLKPELEIVAGRMEDEIKVAKVDTDKSPRLASRYQIEALPTLILFHKGEVVERYMGFMRADELEQTVKKTLARLDAGSAATA